MFSSHGKDQRSISKQMSHAISPMMESLENRQMLSAGLVQRLVDTDGDVVRLRLAGGGIIDTINPATRNILLTGTGISSVLTITVQRVAGGDGLVTLGEIRAYGPMLAINGPSADITHEITINDLNGPISRRNKVSMNLGALKNVAMYTGTVNGQRIATLQLADWSMQDAGQQLNAPSIDTFIITGRADVPGTPADESLPGNSGEAMLIGDSSTNANTISVGTMWIAGSLGDVQASGRIGSITAGAIFGQMQASAFGAITVQKVPGSSIATGRASGAILATGAPGVSPSIGAVSIGAKAIGLTISTDALGIGQISIGGRALNVTVQSARALGSMSVGLSLDGSRIQTRHNVGSISVGGMSDTAIQIGVGRGFPGVATSAVDFATAGAALSSFVVTGIPGQAPTTPWIRGLNKLSAARVGTMSLRNIDGADSLQMFVLDAGSPAQVGYTDVANPAASFLWQPGRRMRPMLAAMLHHV